MTDPSTLLAPPAAASRAPLVLRLLLLLLLVAIGVAVGYVFFKTPLGEKLRDRKIVHEWVATHRMIAPLILVSLYILFGTLMLPVWWIQLSAGYCFGLWWGLLWCEIGAVATAVLSINLSRWLLGNWFRARYADRIEKLHRFDEKLGHNGLLCVMSLRLTHVLPFGISNYLFGLTRITTMDVALGTFLGGSVAVAFYVAMGVGRHLLTSWQFWTVISVVNIVLLVPLLLRYAFPKPFQKIGIE